VLLPGSLTFLSTTDPRRSFPGYSIENELPLYVLLAFQKRKYNFALPIPACKAELKVDLIPERPNSEHATLCDANCCTLL
jgi:hypothetical protein